MSFMGYYPVFFLLLYIYLLLNIATSSLIYIRAIKYINTNIEKALEIIKEIF
jgi:hypothetical protein